jgi:hypothetical protein
MAASYARLGDFKFRLDPDSIQYDYKIDYSMINTIGGQVIQVLGATTGDIVISGSFGEQRASKTGGPSKESWELAEAFHAKIRQLMDAQTLPQQGAGVGVTHTPLTFSYMDGVHDWDFKVLIKSIADDDDDGSIEHKTGKFSYKYKLTLFMVEDRTLNLKKIAKDQFIARIATNGLGWKNYHYGKSGSFEGDDSLDGAIEFIRKHGNGGNLQDYFLNVLKGTDPGGTAVYKADTAKAKAPAKAPDGTLLGGQKFN